ncbi:MAG: AMP-binding protein [Deltaproteobacteria bacterium]|nr:AMP-binding protein [Deltaproteobacteria bacterium]
MKDRQDGSEIKNMSIEIEGCDTIAKLFRHRVKKQGSRTAMREKNFGIWESFSWDDYYRKAKEVGLGMKALGLEKGDVVSILSEDNKEWLFSDMGTQGCGGVTNGVYTTDSSKQLLYILNDSSTKFLFVEDEEQLDKYLEVKDQVDTVKKVIVYDPEGLYNFKDEKVIFIEDLYQLGREYDKKHSKFWEESISNTQPDEIGVIIYTSGTTGMPKGSAMSQRNILFLISQYIYILPFDESDEQLCFLPLCHMGERIFSVLVPLKTGATINFAENLDTVTENLQEVSPTIFFAVPRFWEKFYSSITLREKDITKVGKWAYRWAMNTGSKASDYFRLTKKMPLLLRIEYWLARKLVLDNIKKMLGINRVRFAITGAAPISPDLIKWYYGLGIMMLEGYGQTESTGFISTNRIGSAKIGSVGQILPDVEVKISEQGEILTRSPGVFQGYLNQPELTAQTVVDGWLRTGDVGKFDEDGYLYITDRIKDIIITAGGKNITPSEIENQLKFSPYITDAVVIGDKRKFLSCLIMIDQENVEKYAQDNEIPYTNFASLCKQEEVIELIGKEVQKVNKSFARVEQVKKFRLIDQLLTAEDDELTPTMKLKRKYVYKKYKDLIDSMY